MTTRVALSGNQFVPSGRCSLCNTANKGNFHWRAVAHAHISNTRTACLCRSSSLFLCLCLRLSRVCLSVSLSGCWSNNMTSSCHSAHLSATLVTDLPNVFALAHAAPQSRLPLGHGSGALPSVVASGGGRWLSRFRNSIRNLGDAGMVTAADMVKLQQQLKTGNS